MKEVFRNLVLLFVFSIVFSGLWSCGGSGNSANVAVNNIPSQSSETPEIATEKKPSEYPPLVSAVAQSDLKNLDGSTFKIADKKGKVLLINLWATWCGPCRSEMPALVRMQNEHRDKGFEVIGVDTEENDTVEDINKFAGELGLNYTLVWGDTKLQASLLNISKFPGIPQSFLVDRDGNLRGVFRGANPADVKKMEQLVARVVEDESAAVSTPAEH
jgi:thiol-disulfide isomerase/thioredoxin